MSRRLARAESWLQSRPTDPELLTALGMLCLNGQLWGQAERYLLRSVSRRNDAQTHALLGSLYDFTSSVRPTPCATGAWRRPPALNAAGAGHRRRAAGRRHGFDPYRVDAEGGYAVGLADLDGRDRPGLGYAALPPAATVADYVLDPDARVSKEQHDRALAPEDAPLAGGTSDFDEYFDSAPLPAAAFETGAHARAGAARLPNPRRPGRSVPRRKPPFRTTASIDYFLRHSQG